MFICLICCLFLFFFCAQFFSFWWCRCGDFGHYHVVKSRTCMMDLYWTYVGSMLEKYSDDIGHALGILGIRLEIELTGLVDACRNRGGHGYQETTMESRVVLFESFVHMVHLTCDFGGPCAVFSVDRGFRISKTAPGRITSASADEFSR